MAQKRCTSEQIISKLREAEVASAGGQTIAQTCGKIGVSEQTLRLSSGQAVLSVAPGVRGLKNRPGESALGGKELETENARLKRAVADLTLDKQILREAAEGNF